MKEKGSRANYLQNAWQISNQVPQVFNSDAICSSKNRFTMSTQNVLISFGYKFPEQP